jgi:uncharacterized phage-associated protein
MTVHDAAAYILERGGEMTAMKLQKLVYYSQCWSLVWDETPLFEEVIEAWANGPVSPDLYAAHKGRFKIGPGSISGNPSSLNDEQRATIDEVMKFYGAKSAQWLSDLTHLEAPWRMARDRAGVSDGQNCQEPITLSDMHEYYSGLGQEPVKE